MRRGALTVLLLALAAWPSNAAAAPVLVRARNGAVSRLDDRFLSGPAITPVPARGRQSAATISAAVASRRRQRPPPTVYSVLTKLARSHAITQTAYRGYERDFTLALALERHLSGTRRTELTAVTETLHNLAAGGWMTASRLAVLFQTLDRNRQWWSSGPLLSYGQRIEFAGSPLVWEYYPGQGIQLQVLGSFGKANGLYTAGPAHYQALQQLLGQLIPLAAHRGGGLTWEYYFQFDGGAPPWTSAMSQATGLEALARAYLATHNPYYLQVAQRALPIFSARPPTGVNVPTSRGTRYLQYTFAPGASIINAFLQTLIGLGVYAQVSHSPLAAGLFAAGNAEAQAEVPRFDTGAWSLYQPGVEDDLSYHELVTGFLGQLCLMTRTPVYCTTAEHFRSYLITPPALVQLTARGKPQRSTALRFTLSKPARVGLVVTRATSTVFATSASFDSGSETITVPGLRAGRYGVRIAATDLAGNFTRIAGTLRVAR